MGMFVAKILISAVLIATVSWLSGKKTAMAGFLTALPLTTLLALAFSHIEWGDAKQSVDYAKSVFLAVPLSLTFFLPFLMAQKFQLSFWSCYIGGVVLLGVSYFIHKSLGHYLLS